MPRFIVFVACLVAALPLPAQFPRQNPRGAALTHIQLNSADPAAVIPFWTDVIGTATYSHGSEKGVSTLGVLLLFSSKAPSGPSAGSVIDHLAFRVPDLPTVAARVAKTSYKSFTPPGSNDVLMIDGPDGVRIELMEDNAMYAPLEFNHIHFRTPSPVETQSWYGKYFGARAGLDDQTNTSRLQGGTLTFGSTDTAAPTDGRAIGYLSFTVKDVPGFCDTLKSGGAKLEPPLDPAAGAKPSSVFLTDPWGVRIEVIGSELP